MLSVATRNVRIRSLHLLATTSARRRRLARAALRASKRCRPRERDVRHPLVDRIDTRALFLAGVVDAKASERTGTVETKRHGGDASGHALVQRLRHVCQARS